MFGLIQYSMLLVLLETCRRFYQLCRQPVLSFSNVSTFWAQYTNHDFPLALKLIEEGVDEARRLGAGWELRFGLWMLGQCLRLSQDDPLRAETVYRESAVLSKAAGDTNEYAYVMGLFISGYAMERRQFAEAGRCAEEALKLAQTLGNDFLVTQLKLVVAESMYYLGDPIGAKTLVNECSVFAEGRLPLFMSISPKVMLARISLSQGDTALAEQLLTEALAMRRAAALQPDEFLTGAHTIVDGLSATASAQGLHGRAARLRGVADAMFFKNHHYRRANIDWEYAPYLAVSRSELGEDAFNAVCADGRSMPQSEAVQYALDQGFERGSLQ